MSRLERQEMPHHDFYPVVCGPYAEADSTGGAELLIHVFDKDTIVDQILIYNRTASSAGVTLGFYMIKAGETSALATVATARDGEIAGSPADYSNYVATPPTLNSAPAAGAYLDSESTAGFLDQDGPTVGAVLQMRTAGAQFDKGDGLFLQFSGTATALADMFIVIRCRERKSD